MSAEEKEKLAQEKIKKIKEEISSAIGFRKVIDILIKAKKTLVGHNMFSDLVYTYEQFYERLPLKHATWKENIHKLFPL
jgi:hypothetical protein